jgi:hypothetical protein
MTNKKRRLIARYDILSCVFRITAILLPVSVCAILKLLSCGEIFFSLVMIISFAVPVSIASYFEDKIKSIELDREPENWQEALHQADVDYYDEDIKKAVEAEMMKLFGR